MFILGYYYTSILVLQIYCYFRHNQAFYTLLFILHLSLLFTLSFQTLHLCFLHSYCTFLLVYQYIILVRQYILFILGYQYTSIFVLQIYCYFGHISRSVYFRYITVLYVYVYIYIYMYYYISIFSIYYCCIYCYCLDTYYYCRMYLVYIYIYITTSQMHAI